MKSQERALGPPLLLGQVHEDTVSRNSTEVCERDVHDSADLYGYY